MLIREQSTLVEVKISDETRHGMATKYIQSDDDDNLWYVLHQGTFLATSDELVFDEMLSRWVGDAGPKDKTLAGNRKFTTGGAR